jgi:hypothetical protein
MRPAHRKSQAKQERADEQADGFANGERADGCGVGETEPFESVADRFAVSQASDGRP